MFYKTSYLGLKSQTIFGSKAILIFATSVCLLQTSDEDDYSLRGRIAEGDALGIAIHSLGSINWHIGSFFGEDIRAGFQTSLKYYYGEGNQMQRWYRDEGSISAGTVEENIPYKTESLQYTLGISFGMEL